MEANCTYVSSAQVQNPLYSQNIITQSSSTNDILVPRNAKSAKKMGDNFGTLQDLNLSQRYEIVKLISYWNRPNAVPTLHKQKIFSTEETNLLVRR